MWWAVRGEGKGRRLCAEQGCQVRDGAGGRGRSLLPVELCGTNTCECSTPGCWGGAAGLSPPRWDLSSSG